MAEVSRRMDAIALLCSELCAGARLRRDSEQDGFSPPLQMDEVVLRSEVKAFDLR